MADQRLVGIDRVVNELKKINESVQRTQTYLDANTFRDSRRFGEGFGGASVVNSTGVSALLALLGITTLVPGTIDASGVVVGVLDSQPGLGSPTVEITGESVSAGVLSVATKLRGTADSESDVPAVDFDSQPGLGSSIVEITAVSNVPPVDFDSQPGLGSSVVEITGGSGSIGGFDVDTKFRGVVIAEASASLTLRDVTRMFAGIANGEGETEGDLDVARELKGVCDGESSFVGGSNFIIL